MQDANQPQTVARLRAAVGISVVVFAYLVWPTPYVYIHQAQDIYRVNRITGVKETSTFAGWKTEDQIEAINRANQLKAEQQQAADARAKEAADQAAHEAEFKKQEELARGKELKDVIFGDHNEYKANVQIAYIEGSLRVQAYFTPLNGKMREAYDANQRLVTLEFQNSENFKLTEADLDTSDVIARIENGVKLGLDYDGRIPMTLEQYRLIDRYTVVWRF